MADPLPPSAPTAKTVKRLFAVSGNQCAFPNCATEIVRGATILGEVCHIKAASPKGPRFDPLQPAEDRHSFENLLLLCSIHHTVVDDDDVAYTVDRLATMKRDHEASAGLLPDDAVSAGTELILSINQSGGISAGTVNAHTINVHPPAPAQAGHGLEYGRGEVAMVVFAPELARILAQQVYVLDRAMVNFVCSSCGNPQPNDHWTTFKPWRPALYPASAEFRDLAPGDAALLVEFYDSLNQIDDLLRSWQDGEIPWDTNVWNVLMQTVQHNVSLGAGAAKRFCPDRQFSPVMPAAGTLIERAMASTAHMNTALAAHIERFKQRQQAQKVEPLRPRPTRR